jgi:hypothetical protein
MSFGVKLRHGGHQLAEKYRPMCLPRNVSLEIGSPDGAIKVSGKRDLRSTCCGLLPTGKLQQAKTAVKKRAMVDRSIMAEKLIIASILGKGRKELSIDVS